MVLRYSECPGPGDLTFKIDSIHAVKRNLLHFSRRVRNLTELQVDAIVSQVFANIQKLASAVTHKQYWRHLLNSPYNHVSQSEVSNFFVGLQWV